MASRCVSRILFYIYVYKNEMKRGALWLPCTPPSRGRRSDHCEQYHILRSIPMQPDVHPVPTVAISTLSRVLVPENVRNTTNVCCSHQFESNCSKTIYYPEKTFSFVTTPTSGNYRQYVKTRLDWNTMTIGVRTEGITLWVWVLLTWRRATEPKYVRVGRRIHTDWFHKYVPRQSSTEA